MSVILYVTDGFVLKRKDMTLEKAVVEEDFVENTKKSKSGKNLDFHILLLKEGRLSTPFVEARYFHKYFFLLHILLWKKYVNAGK